MLQFLQRIGKALMLPIAVLPAAGLLLRFGQADLLDIEWMSAAGGAIFDNLPLIFAIGVAIGLSKDGNGAAGLAGAIGYLILVNGTQVIDETINMAALGGIFTGIVAGLTYNKFHQTKLPEWLGFFSGRRLVPIMTSVFMIVLVFIFGMIWPPIQEGLNSFGEWVIGLGAIGAGIFGFFNRILLPFGLHHVFNNLFWFQFGEFQGAHGDLNRFFAGDPTAGIFMAGFFPIMMFGLPAAAFAMIAAAKKENRKVVTGMLAGLAFTSFLTGITEPIEFLFVFIAPALFAIHAVLTAVSFLITNMLGVLHGFGFSAGLMDYLLNFKIATKAWMILPVGLVMAAIYFVVFYFAIKKFDIKTPGREDDDITENGSEAPVVVDTSDEKAVASQYVTALGGAENLETIDNCATRLRLTVVDSSKVDEKAIKALGARGVMKLNKTNVQVIVGTNVQFVADAMKRHVGK